jgi:hypothetical protein
MESQLSATVVIESPLLEVFDYVSNPENLPEWALVYSSIELDGTNGFTAKLSVLPGIIEKSLSTAFIPDYLFAPKIEVRVDDVVHGRRVAYRADTGWTTICDFEPTAGRTILTVTQSLWSLQGILLSYWMGPMQAFVNDILHRGLQGLKRRLEGREIEAKPQIFLSYRRKDSHFVGGRIFDSLVGEFGAGTIFRDTDSLLAGRYWADDIRKAVRQCRVVVVHIGEHWENILAEHANEEDPLRDEIEAALSGKNAQIIPVMTTQLERHDMYERMSQIEERLKAIKERAPLMCEKFTTKLQVQRLRQDPDFSADLEHLMRAVWTEFRGSPLMQAEL